MSEIAHWFSLLAPYVLLVGGLVVLAAFAVCAVIMANGERDRYGGRDAPVVGAIYPKRDDPPKNLDGRPVRKGKRA